MDPSSRSAVSELEMSPEYRRFAKRKRSVLILCSLVLLIPTLALPLFTSFSSLLAGSVTSGISGAIIYGLVVLFGPVLVVHAYIRVARTLDRLAAEVPAEAVDGSTP